MSRIISKIPVFPVCAALYTGLALYFLPVNRYSVDPDGISYIVLAGKYAAGDFAGAVNGVWQPLFAWLLAPALASGAPPVIAGYMLEICIGVLALFAARRLALKMPLDRPAADVLSLALVPAVLQFTFVLLTPDMLLLALVLFYFSLILDPAYPRGRQPLLCGFLGGLAYLAKAYALPFFLAHFVFMNLFQGWRTGRWKDIGAALPAGCAVFTLICVPWIALISAKYGKLTVSTAYTFNLSAALSGVSAIPQGFFAPPNDTAVSIWEDPGTIAFPARPVSLKSLMEREARTVLKSVRNASGILNRFSPFTLPAMILGLALLVSKTGIRRAPEPAALFLSAALFIAGYLPVNVEVRYIWPALVLLVILVFVLAARMTEAGGLFFRQRQALFLLISFVFIAWPMKKMVFTQVKSGQLQTLCARLEAQGVRGRIASSDAWIDSLYMAYFLKSEYYGKKPAEMTDGELEDQLRRRGIEYYFVWQPGPVPAFLRGSREIPVGRMRGLRVFEVGKGE